MHNKKLTGWLILLIVWIAVGGINGLGALGTIEKTWKPKMADYPSLETAVMVFQFLTGAGIVAWLYAGWVLYQRQAGTLGRAQMSLLFGGLLRIVGSWSIVLFGGLPSALIQRLVPQVFLVTGVLLVFTCAWYSYLARSQRVKEIYAASYESS